MRAMPFPCGLIWLMRTSYSLPTITGQLPLPPSVKEHAYELQMEKKLKRLVAEEEKKQGEKESLPLFVCVCVCSAGQF
jgi:hypothetical protein